ncbi:MAG: hypothetical protein IPP22_10270 [Nitrosomonas sp.]|nr:hypothetical protein [Nitrosomonas sp.]
MASCPIPSAEKWSGILEIDALACEGGIKVIIEEAHWHGENVAKVLSEQQGFHEKLFGYFSNARSIGPLPAPFIALIRLPAANGMNAEQ